MGKDSSHKSYDWSGTESDDRAGGILQGVEMALKLT
jgi:hypothetical protein